MSTSGLPRFSNPHHLMQHLELVTRGSLFDDGLSTFDQYARADSDDYLEGIRSLEAIVKKNLGDISERPRKRRKIDNERVTEATTVSGNADAETEPAVAACAYYLTSFSSCIL